MKFKIPWSTANIAKTHTEGTHIPKNFEINIRKNVEKIEHQREKMCKKSPKMKNPENGKFYTEKPGNSQPDNNQQIDSPAYISNEIWTTKYTILTLLPLNIFEQFSTRYANLYFVLIAVLNYLPWAQSLSPVFQTFPIVMVLFVTLLKDAYEDQRRYKSDKIVNCLPTEIYSFKNKSYERTVWKDLFPGDVIRINNNEPVPADCVIVSTSEDAGVCYLSTSNLDGESNLKQFQGVVDDVESIESLKVITPNSDLTNIVGEVKTGGFVNDGFENENRKNTVNKSTFSEFNAQNCVLRGCILRNTDYIEAIVIYTGNNTKAMMNSKQNTRKTSKLESRINSDLPWNFVFMLALAALMSLGSGLKNSEFLSKNFWYLSDPQSSATVAGINFVTLFIAIQTLIPIAIYVSWELVKLGQIYFISHDLRLFDKEKNIGIKCNALNIPEDLGQIEYIFSDKTGTLTENVMLFKTCVVDGVRYHGKSLQYRKTLTRFRSNVGDFKYRPASGKTATLPAKSSLGTVGRFYSVNQSFEKSKTPDLDFFKNFSSMQSGLERTDSFGILESNQMIQEAGDVTAKFGAFETDLKLKSALNNGDLALQYFLCIILCHSALVSKEDKNQLESESADELALLEFAQAYGCKLVSRSSTVITVLVEAKVKSFEILHFVKFDSARKRMSIVVRETTAKGGENNDVFVYSKGADETILELCRTGKIDKTKFHIDGFAQSGLRTLCMAYSQLTHQQYTNWHTNSYKPAQENLDQMAMNTCLDQLETDLTLLGGTGIEDKLQEDVPKTIKFIRGSGIKLWIITGDKMETAVNIGYSCKLLKKGQSLMRIEKNDSVDEMRARFWKFLRNEELKEKDNDFQGYGKSNSSNTSESKSSFELSEKSQDSTKTSLVISGSSIENILSSSDKNLVDMFVSTCTKVSTVIVCRATPKLKAEVVSLMKTKLGVKCLAIGDGANDVAMIQMADIGIGIVGNEGMQASMNSDFAIPKFKMLKQLVFVHGHWSYSRAVSMLLYFIKKHMSIGLLNVFYICYAGFYTVIPIDDMMFLLPNILFNSLPPLINAVFDRNFSEFTLLNKPKLYKIGMKSTLYKSAGEFGKHVVYAVYVSVIIFYIGLLQFYDTDHDNSSFGWYMTVTVLIIHWLVWIIDVKTWTIIHVGSILATVIVFSAFSSLYLKIDTVDKFVVSSFGVFEIFEQGQVWLSMGLATSLTVLPYLVWQTLKQHDFEVSEKINERKAAPKSSSSCLVDLWKMF